MCLAVPCKVVEMKSENIAVVDIGGVKKEVYTELIDNVKVGDYVLLHAGFAIQKLDEEEAKETLYLLKQMNF